MARLDCTICKKLRNDCRYLRDIDGELIKNVLGQFMIVCQNCSDAYFNKETKVQKESDLIKWLKS